MKGKFETCVFMCAMAISVFAMACETDELEFQGWDVGVDAAIPDTPIDSHVPDIPPEIPQTDVPVDTPSPDLPPDLPPDMPPDNPPADVEEEEEPPPPPECPGGPYGTNVGDRIADLSFPTIDGGTVSLCDYHEDITRELLIIYYTTGW